MGGDSHQPLGFMGVAILVEQNLSHLTLDSWAGNPHPSDRIFLPPGVTLNSHCLPHTPRGRSLASMLRFLCSLSPGLRGGCSLLFSEWGGKTLALWLLSNGGGAWSGADSGVACWPHRAHSPDRETPNTCRSGAAAAAAGSPDSLHPVPESFPQGSASGAELPL